MTPSLNSIGTIQISDNKIVLRGEPIEAMDISLTQGIIPTNKRETKIPQINTTHTSNRVSLGKGGRDTNPAFMKEFFGDRHVIYVIDNAIEGLGSFRPNSDHPNNTEYLVKKIPTSMIKAVIVKDVDYQEVELKLQELGRTDLELIPESML